MTQTDDQPPNEYEDGMGGPGAPTPLGALVVSPCLSQTFYRPNDSIQGVGGISERDVQLVTGGGFHTVESVAYTYAIDFLV